MKLLSHTHCLHQANLSLPPLTNTGRSLDITLGGPFKTVQPPPISTHIWTAWHWTECVKDTGLQHGSRNKEAGVAVWDLSCHVCTGALELPPLCTRLPLTVKAPVRTDFEVTSTVQRVGDEQTMESVNNDIDCVILEPPLCAQHWISSG